MKKEIFPDLNEKELFNLLKFHGFKKSEIKKEIEDTKKNDFLWFRLENILYCFVVTYSKHKRKKWALVYAPFFTK